ncbi:10 TM acyl transferase domain found in Cas1p-domain-containing protein [Zopfochytrium polystomum]|nr:10 TM acyl transferase domain found in Cas1p-domain-containing protein [Zopfochytrium polystomum]
MSPTPTDRDRTPQTAVDSLRVAVADVEKPLTEEPTNGSGDDRAISVNGNGSASEVASIRTKNRHQIRALLGQLIETTWNGLVVVCVIAVLVTAGIRLVGGYQPLLYGYPDCSAQLLSGQWRDGRDWSGAPKSRWTVDSCFMASYTPPDIGRCLAGKHEDVSKIRISFAGDSNTRNLFHVFRARMDPLRFLMPRNISATEGARHSHILDPEPSKDSPQIEFYWDPFLNNSETRLIFSNSQEDAPRRLTMFVLGVGHWFVSFSSSDTSVNLDVFKTRMGSLLESIERFNADRSSTSTVSSPPLRTVIRLVSPLFEQRLSESRARKMTNAAVTPYNRYLYSLINNDEGNQQRMSDNAHTHTILNIPAYAMQLSSIDRSADGLHFNLEALNAEVDLLLQELCNPVLFPGASTSLGNDESQVGTGFVGRWDRTSCCVQYKKPNWKALFTLFLAFLFGPCAFAARKLIGVSRLPRPLEPIFPGEKTSFAVMILWITLTACFTVDRTSLFAKTNKVFDVYEFWILNALWVIPGLLTLKREKDSTFLNRYQTDEWKGWMQFAILIYHYTGASAVLPVYSFIRFLVASYLFMTGFGHFTFFITKKSFSLRRVMQVLIRLNLLSVALSYAMSSDTAFYYFGPLVSFWFIAVYLTMAILQSVNDLGSIWLPIKLLISAAICYFIINDAYFLPFVLNKIGGSLLGLHWDVKEAMFRLGLDPWAVHGGMATAYVYLRLKESKWTSGYLSPLTHFLSNGFSNRSYERVSASVQADSQISMSPLPIASTQPRRSNGEAKPMSYLHRLWNLSLPLGALFLIMLASTYGFPRAASKQLRNIVHRHSSILLIICYVIARNATPQLRETSSLWFRWIGTFSLETFILQFHFWLAGDTRGIWRPLTPVAATPSYPTMPIVDDITRQSSGIVKATDAVVATVAFLALSKAVGDCSAVLVEAVVGPDPPRGAKKSSNAVEISPSRQQREANSSSASPSASQKADAWADERNILGRVGVLFAVMVFFNWL